MSLALPDGLPTKVGPAIADNYTGALLAIGILTAPHKREQTGEGGHVDVAMVDTMIHIMDHFVIDYTILGAHSRSGNSDQAIAPFDSFQAKDGMFVLACGTNEMFAKLCDMMGRRSCLKTPGFVTNFERCNHYAALKPQIEAREHHQDRPGAGGNDPGSGYPFGRIQHIEQLVNPSPDQS